MSLTQNKLPKKFLIFSKLKYKAKPAPPLEYFKLTNKLQNGYRLEWIEYVEHPLSIHRRECISTSYKYSVFNYSRYE